MYRGLDLIVSGLNLAKRNVQFYNSSTIYSIHRVLQTDILFLLRLQLIERTGKKAGRSARNRDVVAPVWLHGIFRGASVELA